MPIPMLDCAAEYRRLQAQIDAAVLDVLSSGHYINGPNVHAFEQEAAGYCGSAHGVGVASGTDALHLALRALGIGPGDEVITTPFTFIATAEAIAYTGATPVFADIEPDGLMLDVDRVAELVGPRTRAVITVHLYGQASDLDRLNALCRAHDLALVEDCAQSFGAEFAGRKTGADGAFGCFSFYPSKNLGGMGDGGLVVTANEQHAHLLQVLRNHGNDGGYRHRIIGYNSRLDELQAAILRVKLTHLDAFNEARRRVAAQYREQLQGLDGLDLPAELPGRTHVYHQFTIQSGRRNRIRDALRAEDIACAVYYPVPLHRQEAFGGLGSTSLPVAERAAERVLSLPIFPELSDENIARICALVRKAL